MAAPAGRNTVARPMLRLLPLLLIAFLVAAAPGLRRRAPLREAHGRHRPQEAAAGVPAQDAAGREPDRAEVARRRASRTAVWSGWRADVPRTGGPGGRAPGTGSRWSSRTTASSSCATRPATACSMGMKKANSVPSCPQANGDVPAKLDETMTFGAATAEHGKRTWALVTMRNEATWTGHVGVGREGRDVRRRVPRRAVDQVRRRDRVHGQGAQAQSRPAPIAAR